MAERRETREEAPLSRTPARLEVDLERQPGSNSIAKLAMERTIDRQPAIAISDFAASGGGLGTCPSRFGGRAGRKKERTTRSRPPPAYRPTNPHTRRYNPDVQDADHIRDVLK
jgi:hypothetical protein